MKKYVTLLILFLSHFSSKGQTYVSGFINSNTLWSLSNSPYVVNGNILLTQGFTLIIEPGVTIKFDTNRTLQIDGELIAIGTPTNKIVFTSLQNIQNSGDWGKIQFQDTSVDAIYDSLGNYLSGSIMKYCDVLWGGGIGFGAIQLQYSSPYFTHCNIANSASAGIYGVSSYIIDSSAIKNNNDFGICFIAADEIKVRCDTFIGNLQGGIRLGQNSNNQPLTSMITNNFFDSNKAHGAIYQQGVLSNINILDNLFLNNTGSSVIGENGSTGYLYDCLISCNQFINNTTVCFKPSEVHNITLSYNNFQNNDRIINMPFLYDFVLFKNNRINNCTSLQNLFDFRITNNPTQPFLFIYNNEFQNNQPSVLFHFSLVGASNNSNPLIEIKHNNFLDTALIYAIKNEIPFGSSNIAADSNYWGTMNAQQIDTVILDYFDNGNLSVVYYPPILNFPAEVDTACNSSFPTFIKESKAISVSLFPNPFSNTTNLEFERKLENGTFFVFDLLGKCVMKINNVNEKIITISRGEMISGIYIFKCFEKHNPISSGKLIIY